MKMIRTIKNIIKKIKNEYFAYYFKLNKYGKNLNIGLRTKIYGGEYINFGDDVEVQSDSFIKCFNEKSSLKIGNNVFIGQFNRIGCLGDIIIEDHVLTAPNVFIADHNHEYRDINIPISLQGMRVKRTNDYPNGGIRIGKGTWIGKNVVIVGTLNIGKNCVIGANSIVIHDIPDYSVAVGNPAKVIKYFDKEKGIWVNIEHNKFEIKV